MLCTLKQPSLIVANSNGQRDIAVKMKDSVKQCKHQCRERDVSICTHTISKALSIATAGTDCLGTTACSENTQYAGQHRSVKAASFNLPQMGGILGYYHLGIVGLQSFQTESENPLMNGLQSCGRIIKHPFPNWGEVFGCDKLAEMMCLRSGDALLAFTGWCDVPQP